MTDETPVTPVETPVVPETPVEQVAVTTPDDAGPEIEEKPKGGFQRRIKEVVDDRNYWRELAMRNAPPAVEAPEPEQPSKLPTLEEMGFDEAKYQSALIKHTTELARAEVRRELEQERLRQAEQTRAESFATRRREFAKTAPDFEEKISDPTLPITPAMREVIVDSATGPEIAYYLATNREQAEQIARLPPHLAALEMGRIEGRLSAIKEVKARSPAPVVTKAPPPPPTIEAADAQVEKDPAQMSDAQFAKWRARQIAQRR